MEFFNIPPGVNQLPPEDVRIRSLRTEPWPDGKRIKVFLELTPFQQKPSIDLVITDNQDQELAFASIIETMIFRLVLTMHLPPDAPSGEYKLTASLYYSENLPQDTKLVKFSLPDQPISDSTVSE
jgi:hypothetical protein